MSDVANEVRKARLTTAGTVGPAMFLAAGTFAVWRTKLAHRVDAKLQKVKSAGLPISGSELDKFTVER